MTITTTDIVERYVGDGTQSAWPITFPFFKGEDIMACTVDSTGEQVNLTYGTDYTVEKSTSSMGGTLNYVPGNDVELTIWLSLPITQGTDFYNTGPLNAEVLEASLDRLTLIAQQLQEVSDRSVKVATSSTETPEQLLASLYAGRDKGVASASAAATSETNAATSAQAAATSESNAASSENAAASSAITAQAWAESETAPDPNDAESKSAKSWAMIASDVVPIATTSLAGKVRASISLNVDQATGEATVPVATTELAGIARQATDADGMTCAEVFRISRIGTAMPIASATPGNSFKIADGSLVLFEDYPELEAKYEAGDLMVLDSDSASVEQAENPLYFVANSEGTGLYLPRLASLFARAWVGTSDGTAGGYLAAGLPNITGVSSLTKQGGTVSAVSGALYENTQAFGVGVEPGDTDAWRNIGIDASRSNPIYGRSVSVTPPSYNQPMAIYLGKTA